MTPNDLWPHTCWGQLYTSTQGSKARCNTLTLWSQTIFFFLEAYTKMSYTTHHTTPWKFGVKALVILWILSELGLQLPKMKKKKKFFTYQCHKNLKGVSSWSISF